MEDFVPTVKATCGETSGFLHSRFWSPYDDDLKIILRWIREDGLRLGLKSQFSIANPPPNDLHWPLAGDKLHFDVACLPKLAEYWRKLLDWRRHPQKERDALRRFLKRNSKREFVDLKIVSCTQMDGSIVREDSPWARPPCWSPPPSWSRARSRQEWKNHVQRWRLCSSNGLLFWFASTWGHKLVVFYQVVSIE